jgi:Helix-turn-helix domain
MNHRIAQRPASTAGGSTQERSAPSFVLLTPKEAAARLRVSVSFLAKARMRGDGPPFIAIGRSIRYSETALLLWMRAHQRLSTSQQ